MIRGSLNTLKLACRRNHVTLILFGLALCLAVCGNLHAAEQTAIWNVNSGDWSVATNWDINQVPDNDAFTSYIVILDNNPNANTTTTLDQNATINGITINTNDLLIHQAGNVLSIDGKGATHSGTWIVDGQGVNADILFLQNDQITSPGTIILDGPNARILTNGGLLTLSNALTLIRGSGRILDGLGGVLNSAIIQADLADPMFIQPSATGFSNFGSLRAFYPGGFNIQNSQNFNNLNEISLFSGSYLNADFNLVQTAGSIFLDAGSTITLPNNVDVQAGLFYGEGTVIGELEASGGTIEPGNAGPGLLTVDGIYSQQAAGTLNMDISGTTPGTEYDVLFVSGICNLDGTLNVDFTTFPPDGGTYDIIQCGIRFGAYPTINLTGLALSQSALVQFRSDGVTIIISGGPPVVTPTPTPTPIATPVIVDFNVGQEDYQISDNRKNLGRIGPVSKGDFNGDGYDDFILGAPRGTLDGVKDTGLVYVRFGEDFGADIDQVHESYFDLTVSDPLITNPTLTEVIFPDVAGRPFGGVQFNAELTERLFGDAVAAGDFDGDGIDDIAIGCTERLGTFSPLGPGRVYLFRGTNSAGGLTNPQIERTFNRCITISGRNQGDSFGRTLGFADFDNDGRDDLIIGAPDADQGTVDIVFGRAFTAMTQVSIDAVPNPHTTIIGPEDGSQFGWAFDTGDLDQVVGADIAIGAPYVDLYGQSAGAAYLFAGGSYSYGPSLINQNTIDLSNTTVSNGLYWNSQPGDTMGFSVSIGDYDNDGRDDIALGTPWADREYLGVPKRSGGVFVKYLGAYTNPISEQFNMIVDSDLILTGAEANGKFGQSLASGDLNNDGISDLVIGAPDQMAANRIYAGTTFVIMGRQQIDRLTGGLIIGESGDGYSPADITFLGDLEGDFSGMWLAIGDINGDGRDDLTISGDRAGGTNTQNGTSWCTFGTNTWQPVPRANYVVRFAIGVLAADSEMWDLYE